MKIDRLGLCRVRGFASAEGTWLTKSCFWSWALADVRRFTLKCGTAGHFMRGEGEAFSPRNRGYDAFYDAEAAQSHADVLRPKRLEKPKYLRRVIDHPLFSNVDHPRVSAVSSCAGAMTAARPCFKFTRLLGFYFFFPPSP